MKSKITLLAVSIVAVLFVGCAKQPVALLKTTPNEQNTAHLKTPKTSLNVRNTLHSTIVKTISQNAASIVSTPAAFEKAISSTGTWNIAVTKNLTIHKNLLVNGEYKNGEKDASGNGILERRINLYMQDKDKKTIARLSLTAPKLTINSPQTTIEHGIFKGNIIVSSNNFRLVDTKVDGNVYFTTNAAKSTFKIDAKSKVTGTQKLVLQLKTTSISIVSTLAEFKKAISNNGTCIIVIIKNITIDKDLTINGEYKNSEDILERKVDLYRQNKDNNMVDRLCLTTPKLTINSPQTTIEHGIVKGNIYVSSKNFQLIDAKVEGNIYFTTNEAKSTFKMDTKSTVTGKYEYRK